MICNVMGGPCHMPCRTVPPRLPCKGDAQLRTLAIPAVAADAGLLVYRNNRHHQNHAKKASIPTLSKLGRKYHHD
jgi:hypothetical protein